MMKKSPLLLLSLLVFSLCFQVFNPPRASAFIGSAVNYGTDCSSNTTQWDWPELLRQFTKDEPNKWQSDWPTMIFKAATDSADTIHIMTSAPNNSNAPYSPVWYKSLPSNQTGDVDKKDYSDNHNKISFKYKIAQNSPQYSVNSYKYTGIGAYRVFDPNPTSSNKVTGETKENTVNKRSLGYDSYGFTQNNMNSGFLNPSCIIMSANVPYENSYDGPLTIPSLQLYTSISSGAASSSCGTLDIGCYVARIATSVGSALSSLGQEITGALAWLFIPDSQTISDKYAQIRSLLTDKLGFIADSFTVISNVFAPLINANSAGCTTAGCTKSFGALFGSPFSVDFATVSKTMPSVWTWVTLFIRGIILVGFVFMMRRKIIEIMAR